MKQENKSKGMPKPKPNKLNTCGVRSINSPTDDITVELEIIEGAVRPLSLKITRHGVPEHAFTQHEFSALTDAMDMATTAFSVLSWRGRNPSPLKTLMSVSATR